MKSLISSALILLALYAQACCANEQPFRFIVLSNSHIPNSEQYSSFTPTLYIPMKNSNSGLIFFRSLNTSQTERQTGIKQTLHSQHYGLGLHQQVNSWIFTQVVLQSQHYSHQEDAYETLFNVSMSF
jgi:hypothetical protein